MIDCSQEYGNNGCNGGYYDNAFSYAHNYPIQNTTTYP